MKDAKNKQRLVMIQGDDAAVYEGTERLIIFQGAKDVEAETIEKIRVMPRDEIEKIKVEGN
jgi:hypothetical protein